MAAYPLPEPDRISSRRIGILSMACMISRTLQGSGLRMTTAPSLSIKTNENPRGRSFSRQTDMAAGFVSVMITTSRNKSGSGSSDVALG